MFKPIKIQTIEKFLELFFDKCPTYCYQKSGGLGEMPRNEEFQRIIRQIEALIENRTNVEKSILNTKLVLDDKVYVQIGFTYLGRYAGNIQGFYIEPCLKTLCETGTEFFEYTFKQYCPYIYPKELIQVGENEEDYEDEFETFIVDGQELIAAIKKRMYNATLVDQ
jgi:hypothetical protein